MTAPEQKFYPPDVLKDGNYYGVPEDLWIKQSPEGKRTLASVFSILYPELAMAAGAQEELRFGELSLSVEGIKSLNGTADNKPT